jgi:UDP-N-acetylglucosamine 2-epimerase (non-hydrolysing)
LSWGLNQIFLLTLTTATETVGQILIKIDPLLETEKPDAFFLVLGDTNSLLCDSAKTTHSLFFIWKQVTVVLTSVFPKTNRKIVDHVSDINLTYIVISLEIFASRRFASR